MGTLFRAANTLYGSGPVRVCTYRSPPSCRYDLFIIAASYLCEKIDSKQEAGGTTAGGEGAGPPAHIFNSKGFLLHTFLYNDRLLCIYIVHTCIPTSSSSR